VFSSVDRKLVVLRFCKRHYYYSITHDYHHAQPYPHPYPHSHGVDTVNINNNKATRSRGPATASLLFIIPAFFLFYPKTNAASKQRRELCT